MTRLGDSAPDFSQDRAPGPIDDPDDAQASPSNRSLAAVMIARQKPSPTPDSTGSSTSPVMDPEHREIEALRFLGEMGESRTLEIGSGDGRLLRRLQALASPVIGLDCCLGSLVSARVGPSTSLRAVAADACSLPFHDNSFDQLVFGWSL